jgi:DNA-binding LacI/PurR family transcriptional regulator
MSPIAPKRDRRPSSKDVAALAGVSHATVSAYLNRTRYVSPELCQRIEDAIRARALKLKDTKTMASSSQ